MAAESPAAYGDYGGCDDAGVATIFMRSSRVVVIIPSKFRPQDGECADEDVRAGLSVA